MTAQLSGRIIAISTASLQTQALHATGWLVLHTGIASQRKGKLHQAGDQAMPCGSIASVEESPCIIALPNGPAAPHGSIVTFWAEGKGCLRSLKSICLSSVSFQTIPLCHLVTLQTPALSLL